MARKRCKLIMLLTFHVVAMANTGLGWQTSAEDKEQLRADIKETLREIDQGPDSILKATRRLAALPRARAIPLIVGLLNTGSVVENEVALRNLYQLLVDHNAIETNEGYELLLRGLSDGRLRDISLSAFLNAPEDRRIEVIGRLVELLRDPAMPERTRELLVRTVEQYGPIAGPALDQIVTILRDQSMSQRLRDFAAYATMSIGGLRQAVDVFASLDDAGKGSGLFALAYYLGRMDEGRETEPSNEDRLDRRRAQQFALAALGSSDVQKREAPLAAVFVVFGDDTITEAPEGGYRIHPELEKVVRELAEKPGGAPLQGEAQWTIENLDRIRDKVLRNREKRTK